MRTTLTLDPDLVAKLKDDMRRTGRSFKEVVNERLRLGFLAKETPPKRFTVRPRRMGVIAGLDYNNIGELIELVEGEVTR